MWYTITDNTRKGLWNSISDPNIKDIIQRLLNRNNGTGKSNEAKKQDLILYFDAIAHQDELLRAVISIADVMLTDKNIAHSTPEEIINNSSQIDNLKPAIIPYINDVERFVVFNSQPAIAGERTDKTKLQQIILNNQESLSALLLWPTRLTNTFIYSLANLFIFLKKQKPEFFTTLRNNSLRTIAVGQYSSDIYSNAYLMTANTLRDGFFMGQGVNDYKKYLERDEPFFENFLKGISDASPIKLTRGSPWSQITVMMFKWYQNSGSEDYVKDLLTYFLTNSTPVTVEQLRTIIGKDRNFANYFPEADYNNIITYNTNLTNIILRMEPVTLEYILHLAYTIRKLEKEQA